jgi:branched-chain amino acid transport system substrate-binding protein
MRIGNSRTALIAAAGVFAVLTGVSCRKEPETVRIGVINSLTGPYTAYSEPFRDGMLLGLDTINQKGGIGGKKVELVVEDDHGDAPGAVRAFEKLVNEAKVPAIIGPITAAGSQATAPLANKYHVPMLTIAHTPDLAKAGDYVFMLLAPTDVATRQKAALVIQRFHPKRVAMLDDANPLAGTAVAIWKEQFKANGAEVVSEAQFHEGEKDFNGYLTKFKAAKPDLLLFPAYYEKETIAIIQQARAMDIKAPLVGSGAACVAALKAFEQLVLPPDTFFVDEAFSNTLNAAPEMQSFIQAFSARYNRPAGLEAASGDAALNLVKGAMDAGGAGGEQIQQSLRKTNMGTAVGSVRFAQTSLNVGAGFALFQLQQGGRLAPLQVTSIQQ